MKELKSAYEGYRCLVHDEKHLISYVAECLDNWKCGGGSEIFE